MVFKNPNSERTLLEEFWVLSQGSEQLENWAQDLKGKRKHLCFFNLTLFRSEVILILPRKAQICAYWPRWCVSGEWSLWSGNCVSGGGVEAGEPILCMYTVWLAEKSTYPGVAEKNKLSGNLWFASSFPGPCSIDYMDNGWMERIRERMDWLILERA